MKKVLVVDDVYVMRHTVKKNLESLGYSVVGIATNGYEAIEMYKTLNPDFVTMDITMPSVNGIGNGVEALAQIKTYDPNAKIIVVTSYGEQRLIIDAISKGVQGYILKPITKDKLLNAISKLKFNHR